MRDGWEGSTMLPRLEVPTLLASDCRVQVGRPSTTRGGMSHLRDSTVACPTARRDNVLSVTTLLNVPDDLGGRLMVGA